MDADAAAWRFAAGGQIERESHGIFDLGWRRRGASIELLTDTLDARLSRTGDHGRVEVGFRVAAFAAGLWITPWTDGRPDPDRAQIASYVGPDLRAERWLGSGTYLAASASARYHWFSPLGEATLTVADRPWLRGDVICGWWRPTGEASLTAGADWTSAAGEGSRLSPHLDAAFALRPEGTVAPFASARAVWADHTDDVLATRVGGLTPYHVPLAGAAWAEFWAEDLAAVRLGALARAERPEHEQQIAAGVFVDAAVMTPPEDTTRPDPDPRQSAIGFGAQTRLSRDRWFAEVAGGLAPGSRPEGRPAGSLYLLLGTSWRPIRK